MALQYAVGCSIHFEWAFPTFGGPLLVAVLFVLLGLEVFSHKDQWTIHYPLQMSSDNGAMVPSYHTLTAI